MTLFIICIFFELYTLAKKKGSTQKMGGAFLTITFNLLYIPKDIGT